jgi:radical SAM protein with 4Fe4S-binding SPASM domain
MMKVATDIRRSSRMSLKFRRHPAVRLRRESWGGLAFHRDVGELLELDGQAFRVLDELSCAATLRDLSVVVRGGMRRSPRLPELAQFLQELDERGFVERVPPDIECGLRTAIRCNTAERLRDRRVTIKTSKRELSAPLVAHFAVTYRCNLACPFCYSESHPQRESEPAADMRVRIVERLAEWGVFEVALGGGEPTILSDFPELLAAIRRQGMVPNVTTNGVLKSAKIVDVLAEHAGTVHLSADRSELLDAARGEGISDRIRETVQRLSALHVHWGVNLLLTPHNAPSLDRSLLELQELGAGAVTMLRPKGTWTTQNWPGFPTSRDLRLIAGSVKRFMKTRPALRLYVDTALRGEWSTAGLFVDPEPDVLGCGGGQRHVAITPVGDVYPCSHACATNLYMGNLLRDRLDEVWWDGRGQAARRRFEELCCGTTCLCSGRSS